MGLTRTFPFETEPLLTNRHPAWQTTCTKIKIVAGRILRSPYSPHAHEHQGLRSNARSADYGNRRN